MEAIKGSTRERLERLEKGEVERLQRAGVLIVDGRRIRPLYFDGRFLTARDLTREQSYFLTRLSDLGRSRGFGVVNGLQVGMRRRLVDPSRARPRNHAPR